MSLIQTIKADQLQARKNKDTSRASLLTTLYSEAAMVGKNDGNRESTDAEVVAMVKKFIKNIDETISAVASSSDAVAMLHQEREILSVYLPKQLTEDELKALLTGMVSKLPERSPKSMGMLMKALKAEYDGQYDGKSASTLARELLTA